MPDAPKVGPGTPRGQSPANSAGWLNSVTEMMQWYLRAKASGEIGSGRRDLESTSGLVKVRNLVMVEGDPDPEPVDLERGHYVQLGDYMLDDVDHRKQFYEGNLYDSGEDGRIAILAAAIKGADPEDEESTGEIGAARIIGRCTALVNITDVGHRFAAPATDEYVLQSAASGPVEILSVNKISGTGEQELAVLLGGGSGEGGGAAKFGVTAGVAAAHTIVGTTGTAGSCTVNIWQLNGDGSTEQTEATETWYNLATTGEVPTGALVQAKEIDGLMVIDVQDCAPSLVEE